MTSTMTLNITKTRRIRTIDSNTRYRQFADCESDSEIDETSTPTTTDLSSTTDFPSSAVPVKVQNFLQGRPCKVLFNGEGNAGKTCFLIRAASGKFPLDYIPTVFDNYVATVSSDKYEIPMGLWDTAGRSDYDRLRPLSYPGTDLMVLCFDVSSRYQFEAIFNQFIPEAKHHVPGVTLLLMGLKSDLRNNADVAVKLKERGLTMVSRDEAEQLARKFNMPYMELSALDDEDGSQCKAALETFATIVVERYLPKPKEESPASGFGLFGLVKRLFSWTTSPEEKIAKANQKQVDEFTAKAKIETQTAA